MIRLEVGTVVPAVNPNDLKACTDYARKHVAAGNNAIIDVSIFTELCSEGADMKAVMWRYMHFGLLLTHARDAFAEFLDGDKPDDRLIGLFATFPFRAVETLSDGGYKLNADEFEAELNKLRS